MKKFFITVLFVGLFVTANSAWALNNYQQDKAATKVENAENNTAAAKETAKTCTDKKEGCTAKACETKACCANKKNGTKAACCANKTAATKEAKSCGKKAN